MVLLTGRIDPVEIWVVVHEALEEWHPGAGGMWRWAVHIGADFHNEATCLQAGAEDNPTMAAIRGQSHALVAALIAERFGKLAGGGTVQLDHDPTGRPWAVTAVEEI